VEEKIYFLAMMDKAGYSISEFFAPWSKRTLCANDACFHARAFVRSKRKARRFHHLSLRA
jgi:hypothetical protein